MLIQRQDRAGKWIKVASGATIRRGPASADYPYSVELDSLHSATGEPMLARICLTGNEITFLNKMCVERALEE